METDISRLCVFCGRSFGTDIDTLLVGPDGAVSGFLKDFVAAGIWSRACAFCISNGVSYSEELKKLYLFERQHERPGINLWKIPGYPVQNPTLQAVIQAGDEAVKEIVNISSFKPHVRYGVHRYTSKMNFGLPVQKPIVYLKSDEEALYLPSVDTGEWLVRIYSHGKITVDIPMEVAIFKSLTMTRLEAAAFLGERYRTVSDRLSSEPLFKACLTPDGNNFDVTKLIAWWQKVKDPGFEPE